MHSGEILREEVIAANGLIVTDAAKMLGIYAEVSTIIPIKNELLRLKCLLGLQKYLTV